MPNARAVDPKAIVATIFLENRRPSAPLMSAPTSGSTGINQRLRFRFIDSKLQFQQIHTVNVQSFACAEYRDDDCESHRRFSRGDDHDEEHEYVSVQVVIHVRESDK